ncbi:DUF87 domain-containing protein [Romeria aff. gracilis LEGE 07310]|uniref:DUF87 domain-containing protein n=1 Tax=Vasconcelosia minhoensis LEGE 07310 TaxID=915328 RepID=A0A8J7ABH1_9CYAN|nr:DUF87 domain-containing protein [Romeria gracilis]MBE9079900.1 DUF87 domain-containing protein [Romeria aff. gracilis LEGE 07310]
MTPDPFNTQTDLFQSQNDVVAPPPSAVERLIGDYEAGEAKREARKMLGELVQKDQYVGEVFSSSYETALVQIHDSHRQKVGGIPSLSFLAATRITPDKPFDFRDEDSSVLLLRVMDAAPLPNDDEATRVRVQAARQVAGPSEGHWDDASVMDHHTAGLLSFAGVRCRVIGTFYLSPSNAKDDTRLFLRFGADLSNYYPNRGLKVYKPNGEALRRIVNYRESSGAGVGIGEVRYASTNRSFQGVGDVRVTVVPEDLLAQKSALFGMTRTGKSNTTKIIAKAVFDLRYGEQSPQRVGQVIFDPNGEYANANAQDAGGEAPNALKNVWRANEDGAAGDVITYGILPHPHDPNRKFMLLNFHIDENLSIGKEIIDSTLPNKDSKYIQNFQQVTFETPSSSDRGAMTRHNRRVLAYRTLLNKAGLTAPSNITPSTTRLFNKELIESLKKAGENEPEYTMAARTFANPTPSWAQLYIAFSTLYKFTSTKEYKAFENNYIDNSSSGEEWADGGLRAILEMISRPNGAQLIGQVSPQHTSSTSTDYADDIYDALASGKLVIVDQSSGDEAVNNASARRIVQKIFDSNKEAFRQGKPKEEIPDIIIYAEEAHNLLPSDRETDYRDIWVRTAKEGAKYNLGLIYVTQEVSSIQKNILKNTANWFIGHLNNTDETRELRKFYDFADFEGSILRAQDKGFLRIKTISNPFVIPVQVREFQLRLVQPNLVP